MTDRTSIREDGEETAMAESEPEEAELEDSMLHGGERVTKGSSRDDEE